MYSLVTDSRMMILPLLLTVVTSVASQDEVTTFCHTCVKLESTCYNISYILELNATFRNQIVIPKIGILHHNNLLFYAFEPPIEDEEFYKVAYVNLDDPTNQGIISDEHIKILNFGTFDIDQDNYKVFLGGTVGIFTYDLKKLAYYSSRADTITSLFYKGNVYFVKYGDDKINIKKGDLFDVVLEYRAIKNFIVTKYNVFVFLCDYGLYLKKDSSIVFLSHNPFFRGLTMDLQGEIYAWWIDEIYKIVIEKDLAKSRLVKIGTMPSEEVIGAMTFDNANNIVFTKDSGLYKMTKMDNLTRC